MHTWNTPWSICTCRNVTCMPLLTRSIRSRLAIRAFHEGGRKIIRHDTATLGGGRHHPQGRKQIYRTLLRGVDLGTVQSAPGNRTLPHRGARRSSRSMRSLRTSGHLLQFLPKPTLSEVPDQCARKVVMRPATRTVAGMLLPPGLQRAPHAGAINLAKQEAAIRPVVRCQRRNAAG